MPQLGAIWEPAYIGEEIGAEPLMYPGAKGKLNRALNSLEEMKVFTLDRLMASLTLAA